MSQKGKACSIPGCEYENNTTGPHCVNCRANIAAWAKRKLSDLVERQRKLKMYSSRMGLVESKK